MWRGVCECVCLVLIVRALISSPLPPVLSPQDRAALVANAIAAAKAASVPFILVVSVSSAGEPTIFGAQLGEVEASVKASGIPFAILQLPLFTDNLWYALCV